MKRPGIVTGFCVAAAGTIWGCAPVAAVDASPAALAVLDRTRTTNATYAVYSWNRITRPGDPPIEEGSAEFHKGDLHRVETPRDRVVADCRAQTGAYLAVTTGEVIEGPQIAASACGIDSNYSALEVALLPDVQTDFGLARRVRVTDSTYVREYSVLQNGALVRTTYTENRAGGQQVIVTEAVRVEDRVPDAMMFDRATLTTAFLPADVRR